MSTKYRAHNPDRVYFVTYTTVGWIDVFTRTQYQTILLDSLVYCISHKGLVIHGWVLMPNHVHLICTINGINGLPEVMRDHKKHTSKALLNAIDVPDENRRGWMLNHFGFKGKLNPNNTEYQFWQQKNHYIELSSLEMSLEKLRYIHNNPVRAGLVSEPHHYRLSSSIDYEGGTGLLPLEKLY